MRRLAILAFGLLLLWVQAQATWQDAVGRSGFAYWQAGGGWHTVLWFVNGSEVDDETIYIRFYERYGNLCSSTGADGITIRQPTLIAPADCPKTVTSPGSPPKAVIFSLTHFRAASWSSSPSLPLAGMRPPVMISRFRKPSTPSR